MIVFKDQNDAIKLSVTILIMLKPKKKLDHDISHRTKLRFRLLKTLNVERD